MDSNTILRCHILQLQHEIAMRKVADLPAPAAAHTLENQVLEEDGVIPAAKIMGQLPLEVAPLVVDALIEPVKLQPLAIPVVGTGRTPREIPAPAAQLQKSALEVQGVFNHHTVAQRHVLPQPEVDAYGCTIVCLSDRLCGLVEHHDDEIFPKAVALDGERLHLPIVGTAQRELEAFPDAVHGQDIPVQGIAALLEDNGREIPGTAKLQKSALEVQGVFNHHTVAQRHVLPQPEVDAYGCTIVCLSDRLCGLVEHHDDEIFPKAVALDGERLHLPIVGTAQRELEAFPDAVHGQDIPVQGIAALLEDNGREIPDTAKLRGTLCQASEKTLVAGVETLQYLLHSLRVKQLPVNAVRKVCLHALAVDKPPVHAVVPALKRKGMIPHKASLAEHRVKMPRAPVAV